MRHLVYILCIDISLYVCMYVCTGMYALARHSVRVKHDMVKIGKSQKPKKCKLSKKRKLNETRENLYIFAGIGENL